MTLKHYEILKDVGLTLYVRVNLAFCRIPYSVNEVPPCILSSCVRLSIDC